MVYRCKVCGERKRCLTTDGKCLDCARGNTDYEGFEVDKITDKTDKYDKYECLLPPNCSQRKIKDCYHNQKLRCHLWQIIYGDGD